MVRTSSGHSSDTIKDYEKDCNEYLDKINRQKNPQKSEIDSIKKNLANLNNKVKSKCSLPESIKLESAIKSKIIKCEEYLKSDRATSEEIVTYKNNFKNLNKLLEDGFPYNGYENITCNEPAKLTAEKKNFWVIFGIVVGSILGTPIALFILYKLFIFFFNVIKNLKDKNKK